MSYKRGNYKESKYIDKNSGKHVVKVAKLEKDTNYNGVDVFIYTLMNKDKETIRERITMSEKAGYRLFKFADACQVAEPNLEPEMMLGHYIEIEVGQSAPGKEGTKYEGKTFPQVESYSISTIAPQPVETQIEDDDPVPF